MRKATNEIVTFQRHTRHKLRAGRGDTAQFAAAIAHVTSSSPTKDNKTAL